MKLKSITVAVFVSPHPITADCRRAIGIRVLLSPRRRTTARKSGCGPFQLHPCHEIKIAFFCEEAIADRLINGPVGWRRQPMKQRELSVKLDWKPSIRCRPKSCRDGQHANIRISYEPGF